MKRDDIVKWLQRRAIQAAPFEACGFILNDGEIIEIPNGAEDPSRHFLMTSDGLAKTLKPGQISRIIGIWHTHPKGSNEPSYTDIHAMSIGAVQPDWLYLIATGSAVTWWNPKDYVPQDNSFWNEFVA